MTTQHKALELAERCDEEVKRTVELDVMHTALADTVRAQHALIMQMREELADLKSRMQPNVNGADETYFFIGLKQQISVPRMERLVGCIAAADKYLGEKE
jgi:hypothetical protein